MLVIMRKQISCKNFYHLCSVHRDVVPFDLFDVPLRYLSESADRLMALAVIDRLSLPFEAVVDAIRQRDAGPQSAFVL